MATNQQLPGPEEEKEPETPTNPDQIALMRTPIEVLSDSNGSDNNIVVDNDNAVSDIDDQPGVEEYKEEPSDEDEGSNGGGGGRGENDGHNGNPRQDNPSIYNFDGSMPSLPPERQQNVTTIVIKRDVKSVIENAFSTNWTSVTEVKFEDENKVTSIGARAFFGCTSLLEISIPASVKSIGQGAFYENTSLKYASFASNSMLISIGAEAFFGCTSLLEINIPTSVESIGEGAFYRNTSLKHVNFGSNSMLISIGKEAFSKCRTLSTIKIPPNVSTIPPFVFYQNSSLEKVTFHGGSSLKSIGNHAFYECKISQIDLPASLQHIHNGAFQWNQSLRDVTFELGSQLESIGNSAFDQCGMLQKIEIPESVTSIGDLSFRYNSALMTVTFRPESKLGTIGSRAFFGCKLLKKIEIPALVKNIGQRAFCKNESLETVTVIDNVSRFSNETMFSLSIRHATFALCETLKRVHLGDNLSHLGRSCFMGCKSLEEVQMGCQESISIGKRIFENCESMDDIELLSSTSIKVKFKTDQNNKTDGGHFIDQEFISKCLYTVFAADILEWVLNLHRPETLKNINRLKRVEFQLLIQKMKSSQKLVSLMSRLQADREVVFLFMLDGYVNVALLLVFSFAAIFFFEDKPSQILIVTSIVLAVYLAIREIVQFLSEGLWMYIFSYWNWFDLARIVLVLVSSTRMIREEGGEDISLSTRSWLLLTGVLVILGMILFLRNAFLPHAKFVGGLIAVAGTLWPFVAVSCLMVFAFGYSFFALGLSSSSCGEDEDGDAAVCTLSQSVVLVFSFLFGGPGVSGSATFDLLFGFIVVVVLLNVLIAVVGEVWQSSSDKGAEIFFGYRLAFLAEVESLFSFFEYCYSCVRSFFPSKEQPETEPAELEEYSYFAWLRAYLDSRVIRDDHSWSIFPYNLYNNAYEHEQAMIRSQNLMKYFKSDIQCKVDDDSLISDDLLEQLRNMGSFERDWYWAGKRVEQKQAEFKKWRDDKKNQNQPEDGRQDQPPSPPPEWDYDWRLTRWHVAWSFVLYVILLFLGLFLGFAWPKRFREDFFSIPFPRETSELEIESKKFEKRLDAMELVMAKKTEALETKLETAIKENMKAMKSILERLEGMKQV